MKIVTLKCFIQLVATEIIFHSLFTILTRCVHSIELVTVVQTPPNQSHKLTSCYRVKEHVWNVTSFTYLHYITFISLSRLLSWPVEIKTLVCLSVGSVKNDTKHGRVCLTASSVENHFLSSHLHFAPERRRKVTFSANKLHTFNQMSVT